VVALGRDHTEQALLEDGVAFVPEREGEDEDLIAVADARQAVLAPTVSAAARRVVGQVVPGVAGGAVVLADGAPRALGDVGTPAPPGGEIAVKARQPLVLARRQR
jgi:hypothetical protein